MATNLVLQVEGMSCNHCVNAVENAVRGLNGADTVKVNLEAGTVEVAYNEDLVNDQQIKDAIEEQGYDVK
ncbi:copper chaperone CopZ [Bhargavaea beijingensis]|uniref:Copper chaperone CopZ n=1 Tax=Bhargavaea beijingensis TaxID=426756 RepID=A0A1G7F804_9BACL|nr:copper chaperone CopZ [Bhargavaea beijingensis]MCW1927678.1 copper chaperone CopZ [Bhargavaea beijingensis]RSK33338.1 copper chaperone [Bhargavaea beijingensis]SDE72078.1 copper chaperone [Bhargavaea beijingensis]